jgi:peptidoglycan/LPS O-acetylase OafA/YrhL
MAVAFLLMIPDFSIDGAVSKGIPAFIIVWSFLYAFKKTHNAALMALGDASYAIYLYHGFALSVTFLLFQTIGFNADGPIGIGFSLAVYLLISSVTGILVYRVIEKPLSDRLRNTIDTSRRLRSSANLLESARALNGTGKVSDGDIHKDLTKA